WDRQHLDEILLGVFRYREDMPRLRDHTMKKVARIRPGDCRWPELRKFYVNEVMDGHYRAVGVHHRHVVVRRVDQRGAGAANGQRDFHLFAQGVYRRARLRHAPGPVREPRHVAQEPKSDGPAWARL